MQYKLVLVSGVLFGVFGTHLAADRYYERKAHMRGGMGQYIHAEPEIRTITVTITNMQWSAFQRLPIALGRYTTYDTIAGSISARLFADGTLMVQQDERNFKDVTMSNAHCNDHDRLYFMTSPDQTLAKKGYVALDN